MEQRAKDWDKSANHESIVSLYSKASQLGYPLEGYRQQRWAETLASLEQFPAALELLAAIKDDTGAPRHEVLRRIIERRLNRPGADAAVLEPLIVRFEEGLNEVKDRDLRRTQRIWASSVRGRMLLASGELHKLIDGLQVQIIRFMDEGRDDDLAPLLVLLGQAYHQLGDYSKALTHYRLAQKNLLPSDPDQAEMAARILVGLGQLTLANPDHGPEVDAPRQALEYFIQAEMDYRSTDAYLDALFGRASCEARLGMHQQSLEHFGLAVRRMMDSQNPPPLQVQLAIDTLRRQHVLHFDRGEYALALDYLKLLSPIYGDPWPAEPLLQLSETYLVLAQHTETESNDVTAMGKADGTQPPVIEQVDATQLNEDSSEPRVPIKSLRSQLRIDAARLYENCRRPLRQNLLK
ncbi:MAG: hypothetical protein HC898_09560 [Phycisphaerales bacterium]|nr:hypothetical protein [Phycisphaerales bacterium]